MPKKKGFPYDGYFKVPNAIFGTRKKTGWIEHIGHTGFVVYAFILRRYDFIKQESIYESHRAMAKRLNIARNTLEKHLMKLQGQGLICRQQNGRRRHTQWQYVPVLPVREPSKVVDAVVNGSGDEPINERMAQPVSRFGSIDEAGKMGKAIKKEPDNPLFNPPRRLYRRLNKNMCVKKDVEEIIENTDRIPLKTQVQVGWRYWCYLWEQHYRRPYYLAKAYDNARIISKDKKNLRTKIAAVGFGEVIARMHRCFDICDDVFPCKVNGKWKRPISFNDFINNHFFDQWIVPVTESREHAPKASSEKVKATMEKRAKTMSCDDVGVQEPGGDLNG